MKTATQVLESIQSHAIAHQLQYEVIEINAVIGVPVAQGDVNFWLLPCIPEGALETYPEAQLVEGNSLGSNHRIRQTDIGKVKFFTLPNPNPSPLTGRILELLDDIIIEHPTHKHQLWKSGSIIGITFQRLHSQEVKRQND